MSQRPRPLQRIAPVLALLALTACDAEVVLSGNFDEWTSGFSNGPLPGDPNGDSLFQFQVPTPGGGTWFPARAFGTDQMAFVDAACPIGQPCPSPARMAIFSAADLTAAQANNPFTWALGGDAYLQPGCNLDVHLYNAHYDTVAVFRFARGATGDGTLSIEHDDGTEVLETLGMGDSFGYAVYADPVTDTFDVIGASSHSDLPVMASPDGVDRGVLMLFANPSATGCAIVLDGLEAHAEN